MVKRYDCDVCYDVGMTAHVSGDWVPYSDYATLLKERDALAAENAGLSAVLMSVIDPSNEPAYQSLGMGCGVEDNSLQTDGYGACEYGWREAMERVYSEVIPEELPETPATDAFLAEVRAQGVEMLYASRAAQWDDELLAELNEFATQLRKGVQS